MTVTLTSWDGRPAVLIPDGWGHTAYAVLEAGEPWVEVNAVDVFCEARVIDDPGAWRGVFAAELAGAGERLPAPHDRVVLPQPDLVLHEWDKVASGLSISWPRELAEKYGLTSTDEAA